jgi:aldehyde dehydrogenase
MQATENAIRQVVEEVLSQLSHSVGTNGNAATQRNGYQTNNWGVFTDVDAAVTAAQQAFEQLSEASVEKRRIAIDIVKSICEEQADELGRLELEETKIGRLDHKIDRISPAATEESRSRNTLHLVLLVRSLL